MIEGYPTGLRHLTVWSPGRVGRGIPQSVRAGSFQVSGEIWQAPDTTPLWQAHPVYFPRFATLRVYLRLYL